MTLKPSLEADSRGLEKVNNQNEFPSCSQDCLMIDYAAKNTGQQLNIVIKSFGMVATLLSLRPKYFS